MNVQQSIKNKNTQDVSQKRPPKINRNISSNNELFKKRWEN